VTLFGSSYHREIEEDNRQRQRDAAEAPRLRRDRDELADSLRWIASNCKPYGPAQARAANTLCKLGLSLEFRDSQAPNGDPS
jgi:hypothetical protein